MDQTVCSDGGCDITTAVNKQCYIKLAQTRNDEMRRKHKNDRYIVAFGKTKLTWSSVYDELLTIGSKPVVKSDLQLQPKVKMLHNFTK